MATTTDVPAVAKKPTSVDPSLLELMGKQASRLYLEKGVNLNDAIVKLAAENPAHLGTEHLRRVAEFANMETHQSLFKTSQDKVFSFPLADAERIVQDVHNGSGTKLPVLSSENAVRSAMPKVASVGDYFPGVDSVSLEEGYGEAAQETYPDHNPYGAAMTTLDQVKTAQEECEAQRDGLAIMLDQTGANVLKHIKQASLYGYTLADLRGALEKVAQHGPTLKHVLEHAQAYLSDELHVKFQDQEEKTASGALNTEHPLVQTYLLYEGLAKKERVLEKAAAKLGAERARLGQGLRDRLRHDAQGDHAVQSSSS